MAQQAPAYSLAPLSVIGVSPMPGSGIDRDKVPGNAVTIGAGDIDRNGAPDLVRALQSLAQRVDLRCGGEPLPAGRGVPRFREPRPCVGTPAQGLAVYQNGVRINEAFGDTVNWDLFRISRSSGSTRGPNAPGLNALGGACP